MGAIEGGVVTAIPDPDTERRRWRATGGDPSRPTHGRSRSDGDEHHVAVGSDRPTRLAGGGCDPSPRWRTLNAAQKTRSHMARCEQPVAREPRREDEGCPQRSLHIP